MRRVGLSAWVIWLLACGLLIAVPTASLAQAAAAPPTETMAQSTTTDADMTDLKARSHFRLGREYYDQGRFAEAAKEFEIAHGLSGRGSLLYNVYLAYRDAQDTPNAARALRGYLAAVPNAENRENLVARLAAFDALLKQAEEDAARQEAEAAEAARKAQEADQKRAEADQRALEAEQRANVRPSRPWWPWLLVGGGLAATATGIVLGTLATSDADELRDQCVADPRTDGATAPLVLGNACATSVDLESRRDSIQTQATIGDALWIGGAVIATTGLVLAFALPDVYPELEKAPVTAACSPSECRAVVRFNF